MSDVNETDENAAPQRRHFHTFDALRFLACFKVFLHHLPIYAFPWFTVIKSGGGIGVQFFFVLSGFLITYIICEEKQRKGSLDLKNFFLRRVLRIWPLFYLMIGVAYITPYILDYFLHLPSSAEGYEPTWWMSLLFLENYKMMATGEMPNVSPLSVMWSLCVEEHFYIVWGLLLYFSSLKQLLRIIISCILLAIAMRVVYWHYGITTGDLFTNIDLFAFGAIPAYLLISKPAETERFIEKVPFRAKQCFVVLLLLTVVLCGQAESERPYILLTSLLGAFFSLLIIFTLPSHTKFRIGNGNLLSKLGVYTYGFYLYHTLVINLCLKIFDKWGLSQQDAKWAVLFTLTTFLLSMLCSILSYHFFEKYFLRLKGYFRT